MSTLQNDRFAIASCESLCLPAQDGEVELHRYSVFPGMDLIICDAHAHSCLFPPEQSGNCFEIRHCRQGRWEAELPNTSYYLGSGDLSIARPHSEGFRAHFPLHHYHGISLYINVDQAPQCLSCLLDDVRVQPMKLMQKFLCNSDAYVARSQPAIEHIFSELYSVPTEIRQGYYKVKVLELFLFLSTLDPHADELNRRRCSNTQKTLAHSICQYLMAHMDRKVTLEDLTDSMHASGTQIKSSIRCVYGMSLYSFIRNQKMESAAAMLRDTDQSILEIAGLHGYDNASKFAGAFKTVMGKTPREYRLSPENRLV